MKPLHVKDKLFAGLVRSVPHRVTPNMLTTLRLILALPLLIAIVRGWLAIAFILFIIAVVLDGLDGALARARNQITKLGMALDPIADKVVFIIVFLPLGALYMPSNLFVVILMLELLTIVGTALFPLFMKYAFHAKIPIVANEFGQYKTALYGLGVVTLFGAPASAFLAGVSTASFWLGVLCSIASFMSYIVMVARAR